MPYMNDDKIKLSHCIYHYLQTNTLFNIMMCVRKWVLCVNRWFWRLLVQKSAWKTSGVTNTHKQTIFSSRYKTDKRFNKDIFNKKKNHFIEMLFILL